MKTTVSAITVLFAIMAASVCSAAPAFTNISTANVGANIATLVMESSESGTGYFTLLTGNNPACGSSAQVKEGKTFSGANAPFFGSLPLAANTDGFYTVRNLTHSTAYSVCLTADSSSGTSPVQPASFTTITATTFPSPEWRAVGNAGFSDAAAHFTSLAFAPDGTPYVAYVDANNSYKITVMKYSGNTWGPAGNAEFAASTANPPSLAFAPDGTPHLSFVDANNNYRTTVMSSTGTLWNAVGSGFFADTDFTSLAFAPDGTPYVSYIDANDSKATVMKYSAGDWNVLGNSGLSTSGAWSTSLAIAPDGTPYVAYSDYGNSGKATVMKFNGSGWINVGSAGFSAGTATNTSLAIAPDGTLFVAYQDGGNSRKVTVMKSGGAAWSIVGSAGFSAGTATNTSLAIAPDGTTLYVAYQDGGNSYKATVMKSSGAAWSTVASAGFSAGTANSTSLAFAQDGTPYVAYGDDGNGSRATVMKLINLSPTISSTHAAPATVGVAYSFTPMSTYADSFTVTDNFPPGLIFSQATGTLSGTPTTAGTYSDIIITATNSIGSATLQVSIEVINFPDTIITSYPGSSSASFSLSFSSIPSVGSTFECNLNGGGYTACPTPYSSSIAPCATCRTDTSMSFLVRAKNQAGNYDPSPATHTWAINQTIGNLFANVSNGGAVQLKAIDYSENLNLSRGVAFTLKGGYDSGYSTNSGLTNIHGTFTISGGTVTFENIVIM